MRLFAGLAAVLLAASGCASTTGDDSEPEPTAPAFVNPIGVDHEHSDLSLHQTANNITLVGHNYITPTGPPGGLGEVDVGGHYAFIATFNHGFTILDIADPAHPVVVSITEIPTPESPLYGKYTADLKVTADGDWVFLAMEVSATPGVLIYDARDKAAPKLAGFWASPGLLLGCHMVEYAIISEQEYLFCAPLDNAIYVGLLQPVTAAPVREVVTIARWVPNSLPGVQNEVDRLLEDPQNYPFRHALSGHQDMTYQEDPVSGTPMLYVSFWNLGLRIVDVSIPAAPIEVGFWDGEGAEHYGGNFHTAMAYELDGRRIVAVSPEGANPPAMFLLDFTDLGNPTVVTQWRALDEMGNFSTQSMHNFQIVQGRIYLAMYHAGLWVLDVSSAENATDPYVLGTYLPHEPRPDGANYTVGVWDVVVWHGYMLTADSNSGFYVLNLRTDMAGDEYVTSFA